MRGGVKKKGNRKKGGVGEEGSEGGGFNVTQLEGKGGQVGGGNLRREVFEGNKWRHLLG